jgi:hypothetical protein
MGLDGYLLGCVMRGPLEPPNSELARTKGRKKLETNQSVACRQETCSASFTVHGAPWPLNHRRSENFGTPHQRQLALGLMRVQKQLPCGDCCCRSTAPECHRPWAACMMSHEAAPAPARLAGGRTSRHRCGISRPHQSFA